MSFREFVYEVFQNPDIHMDKTDHIIKPNLAKHTKIIDASFGGAEAQKGFYKNSIPTARFLNVSDKLRDTTSGLPNTFPTEKSLRKQLET